MAKPKVLFICLGNSCRSIMAEALTRHRCGNRWEAASAGLAPLGFVAPGTITALAEIGVSTAGLYSKGLEELDLAEYCLVINLTRYSLEGRIPPNRLAGVRQRPAPDPYGGGPEEYRRSRDLIEQMLIQELCRKEENWAGL